MPEHDVTTSDGAGRRESVLDSAMQTFVRFGYRKTSMDDVARAAQVSRQGLYFLFDSKPALFREAVTRALARDLDAVADALSDGRPLRERLLEAFDRWAGSFIGPLTDQTGSVRDFDPALLGPVLHSAPRHFEDLVTAAIAESHPTDAPDRARTLISASIGIKHQVETREQYAAPMAIALDLVVGPQPRADR
ncbi:MULTISPECIES: TetR/AcrR family transcriptional regulator [unclassified Curtobacterium]|uniref:TetR/AcrR family transcriptional regulator n=1 Tax=unclassified Curtobacterium TaxID=257496 RepID=UPI00226B6692|nr:MULTISPECIES: TetR/AcrR family transcriptional regulator [unclassified Curtobacterium]